MHPLCLASTLVITLVAMLSSIRPASAQGPPIAVSVDRGNGAIYYEGDPIRICVTVNLPVIAIYPPPPPPLVRVTNSVNGGPARVVFEEHFWNGQRCINSTITPPLGQETIRAEVIAQDGHLIAWDETHYTSLPRTQPPPANASISVNRGAGATYAVGETIRICYDIPAPGQVTITDILADGRSHVLLSGFDDGTGGCFNGLVTLPMGTECLRLDYATSAGSGSTQVCFHVVGSGPHPGVAFIRTDRSQYRAGDTIQICYDVPGPGPITIRSLLPGGGSRVVLSGHEDGTGACFLSTLGPEVGIKCLRLEYNTSGGSGTRQTCFYVTA